MPTRRSPPATEIPIEGRFHSPALQFVNHNRLRKAVSTGSQCGLLPMYRHLAGSSRSPCPRPGRRLRLTVVAIAVALAGCSTSRYTAFQAVPYTPYRLSAGDKVRVLVFGQDNISNIYSVDATGRISM